MSQLPILSGPKDQHADSTSGPLRVALVAGTLAKGGAEKQLVYMARALRQSGADVRVYSLTRNEFYEAALRGAGIPPIWVGQLANPASRLTTLMLRLYRFRPHIIQSTHSYANLYASLAGRLFGAISIGALRSSLRNSSKDTGAWNSLLMRSPAAVVLNSQAVAHELSASGLVEPERLYVVPNVIDIAAFDADMSSAMPGNIQAAGVTAAFIGRLVEFKRLDRFLYSLAQARQHAPLLKGIVVGDGPQRNRMEALADELGLRPGTVTFLGQRDDISRLLRLAAMHVLTSDGDEGFPNVILEAMAARLPVITTPAGDAGAVVLDGLTGFVVPFDNTDAVVARMVELARRPDLRQQLGSAGRRRVEQFYGFDSLSEALMGTYRLIAERLGVRHVRDILTL